MARPRTVFPELVVGFDGRLKNPRLLYCVAEIGCEASGPCKIGVANQIRQRRSALQSGNWRELVVVWQLKIYDRDLALQAESHCLMTHRPSPYDQTPSRKRLKSEWIDVTPAKALETATKLLSFGAEPQFLRVV